MNMKSLAFALVTVVCSLVGSLYAQDAGKNDQMQDCPMHKQHADESSHHAMVEKHGDQAMGFPHDKTTHHFRMAPDGGAIEVTTNDLDDKTSTEAIRLHLSHIAVMFRNGDFSTPAFVHDGVPPGVTTMEILKDKIQYQYEEIASGGRVRIGSSDPIAVAAIHDFLRFQITDHQTGDSLITEKGH
jgi:hypothetical protein